MGKKTKQIIPIAKSGYYGYDKLDGKDTRAIQWKKERKERGFDSSELWSLGDTIVNFSIPRIKAYMEHEKDTSANYDESEQEYLDLIEGLELFVRNNGSRLWNDAEKEKVEKSLNDFGNFLPSMWN